MFSTPLLELVFHAARVHRMYNDPQMVRASLSQQAPRLQPVFPGAVNRPVPLTSPPRARKDAHPYTCSLLCSTLALGRPATALTAASPFECSAGGASASIELPQAGWVLPQVQRCTLLSIKTGGCPETCTYCAQSTSWSKEVGLKAEKLMGMEEVLEARPCFLRLSYSPFCVVAVHAALSHKSLLKLAPDPCQAVSYCGS